MFSFSWRAEGPMDLAIPMYGLFFNRVKQEWSKSENTTGFITRIGEPRNDRCGKTYSVLINRFIHNSQFCHQTISDWTLENTCM